MYTWHFEALRNFGGLFLRGTGVTVSITVAVVVFGLALGMVAGLMQVARSGVLRWASWGYIELFRLTPLLVQLLWFYYGLPMLAGVEMTATTASVLALSLYGGSFYAEVIRGGIVSIERAQTEAGLALGMRPGQVMRRVVVPQAVKRMIPPLMNQSIIQFKNTSLVSVLAVPDLLYQAQYAATETYRPLEVYTVIALIYIVVLLPATALVKLSEKRLLREG